VSAAPPKDMLDPSRFPASCWVNIQPIYRMLPWQRNHVEWLPAEENLWFKISYFEVTLCLLLQFFVSFSRYCVLSNRRQYQLNYNMTLITDNRNACYKQNYLNGTTNIGR
jgi:hypothetical protein